MSSRMNISQAFANKIGAYAGTTGDARPLLVWPRAAYVRAVRVVCGTQAHLRADHAHVLVRLHDLLDPRELCCSGFGARLKGIVREPVWGATNAGGEPSVFGSLRAVCSDHCVLRIIPIAV